MNFSIKNSDNSINIVLKKSNIEMSNNGIKIICLLALLAMPNLVLLAKKATITNIPGIDSLPAAKSFENPNEDSKKDTKNQTLTKDEKKNPSGEQKKPSDAKPGDLSFPLITKIKVIKGKKNNHSVKVTWNVSSKNTTAIYVARYMRPIESRQLILDADVISSPLLDPQTTSYTDYNIPDGTYYYVVVTSFEMSGKNRLKLKAEQNYNTNPSVVYRKKYEPESYKPEYSIDNLYAVNMKNNVILSWPPAKVGNIKYIVYKSYQPVTDSSSLEFARKIGEADQKTLQFTDAVPIENRLTYYFVLVKDLRTQTEHKVFQLDKNLIKNTFSKTKIAFDKSQYIPSSLTPYMKSRNVIEILWNDPIVRVPSFSVYRSNQPISNVSRLRKATFVGHVPFGQKTFVDTGLKSGLYYYAVLPQKSTNKLLGIFIAGRTFTSFPIKINAQKQSEIKKENKKTDEPTKDTIDTTKNVEKKKPVNVKISYFAARNINNERIKLNWSAIVKGENIDDLDYHFLIYRSTSPLSNIKQVHRHGSFLSEMGRQDRSYIDNISKEGRYYYALLIDINGKITSKMISGRNYLRGPIVIKKKKDKISEVTKDNTNTQNNQSKKIKPVIRQKPIHTMSGLNRILAQTYHRNRLTRGLKRIAPYKNSKVATSRVKAKAILYTGLSWYKLGRYRVALEYFLHSKVRTHYPERSRFWYQRCIEKAK